MILSEGRDFLRLVRQERRRVGYLKTAPARVEEILGLLSSVEKLCDSVTGRKVNLPAHLALKGRVALIMRSLAWCPGIDLRARISRDAGGFWGAKVTL